MNSTHEIITGIVAGLVMVAYLWIIWTLRSKTNSTKYSSSPRVLKCRVNVERLVTGANPSDELPYKKIELNLSRQQSLPSLSPGGGLNIDATATSHSETHKTSPMEKMKHFQTISARFNQALELKDKIMWDDVCREFNPHCRNEWSLEDILSLDRILVQGQRLFNDQDKK